MSAAIGTHSSGAGPLSLMSCVRESSPLQDYELDGDKCVTTKKRFWNPKKWFKKKNKVSEENSTVVPTEIADLVTPPPTNRDAMRSRFASELSISDEQIRRRSGSSIMPPGLSVSHDSVFHSPNSDSDMDLEGAQSSSSLSISQPHHHLYHHHHHQLDLRLQTELSERLRLRRGRGDTSEDDEGLPHSLCNSPTTTEAPLIDKTAIKDLPTKSHSTCSDGSLLSMDSSEMDEDSFGQQSRHSSKLSLHEKKLSEQGSDYSDLDDSVGVPLNHSAAHHKVSVRPRRTHAVPRRKRAPHQLTTALPTTLEVNEEASIRSITPENISTVTSLSTRELHSLSMSTLTLTETQLKCSSLPPGLAAPPRHAHNMEPNDVTNKINRSHSNAASHQIESLSATQKENNTDLKEKSFFDRIFPRRSARKKKLKETGNNNNNQTNNNISNNNNNNSSSSGSQSGGISATAHARYSGAASRQRIQPIDIPVTPESPKRANNDQDLPEERNDSSPLHLELESRFKYLKISSTSNQSEKSTITEEENIKSSSKVKIPALSSLQQRVLLLNESDDNNIDDSSMFKSLTNFQDGASKDEVEGKSGRIVAKSHSFKLTKSSDDQKAERNLKSNSLDSIKLLDDSNFDDITISGPSHVAVVNVTNLNVKKSILETSAISVTKIQLKQPTQKVGGVKVPEFINKQLNKIESKQSSNVVLSIISPPPRIVEEKTKSTTNDTKLSNSNNSNNFSEFEEKGGVEGEESSLRKFSRENVEIVDKEENEEIVEIPIVTIATNRYKKNDNTNNNNNNNNNNKIRSISLDSLKSDFDLNSDEKSSQDSLDKLLDNDELKSSGKVAMRKKSGVAQKKRSDSEEPELMKVFARRSLKLKDTESEQLSNQVSAMISESDKENLIEDYNKKKFHEAVKSTEKFIETVNEVTLRKPSSNFFAYQRTVSLNQPKVDENSGNKIRKQASFHERKNKIESSWISCENKSDYIDGISPKSEFIEDEILTETKNFNQRKAEWEKRAQEAKKKSSVP